MIELICPDCKNKLSQQDSLGLICLSCKSVFPIMQNVVSFINLKQEGENIEFYKVWQRRVDKILADDAKRRDVYKTNKTYSILSKFFRKHIKSRKLPCLFFDYFSTRRDFFFKDFLKRKPYGIILDVGCGRGSKLFTEFGDVVGIDFNIDVLVGSERESTYSLLVHADMLQLPFNDGQFDYIVSSDFLEHIPSKKKDAFYREMNRVLKKNGFMAHFLTTDSQNLWFLFAHRYPDLFEKYLIKGIGGHHGLELPTQLIENIKDHGFNVTCVKKMLWEPWEFVLRFDNEYKEKSILIRCVVNTYKILMKNDLIFMLACVPIGILFRFIESIMPLNYSNKLGIVFKKY